MSDTRTGGCLCGAVRFEADLTKHEFGACHCEMCRRWTGSALLGITVPAVNIRWTGEEAISRIQSSGWAERAFCSKCGSPLYYHVTMDGPHQANMELPIGLLDDPGGLTMTNEIYIDVKPDSFAYAGEGRKTMTRAEVIALYGAATSQNS
jgi:Uncharacterized conserved protein